MTATIGRKVVDYKTNKTGGSVIKGDVLIPDTTNDNAFTTTTSAGYTGGVWIADETIPNNATGRVVLQGHVTLVNVNASVTRGNYGKTHTVAKQATDAGSARTAGTFCRFTTGGTTPEADIWPVDLLGTSLTDPTSNRGEIIRRGAAALEALSAKTLGKVVKGDGTDVVSGYIPFIGCKAYNAGTQSVNGTAAITFGSDEYDTDTIHDTGSNTSRMTVPTGMDGKWRFTAGTVPANSNISRMYFQKNGTTVIRGGFQFGGETKTRQITCVASLVAGDYVELIVVTAGACAMGHASDLEQESWMSAEFLGV